MRTELRNRLLYSASRRSKLEAEELLLPFIERIREQDISRAQAEELIRLLDLDDITLLEAFAGSRAEPDGTGWAFEQLRGFWSKK